MSAASAFLGYFECFVEVDLAIRAFTYTTHASTAFLGVDDNKTVIPGIYSIAWTRINTGSTFTVLAGDKRKGYFHLGYSPSDFFIYLAPELTCFRLRFGIWSPIVATVFIFTGNLTGMTSGTSRDIDNKGFH
jgi:hypothetical protein